MLSAASLGGVGETQLRACEGKPIFLPVSPSLWAGLVRDQGRSYKGHGLPELAFEAVVQTRPAEICRVLRLEVPPVAKQITQGDYLARVE